MVVAEGVWLGYHLQVKHEAFSFAGVGGLRISVPFGGEASCLSSSAPGAGTQKDILECCWWVCAASASLEAEERLKEASLKPPWSKSGAGLPLTELYLLGSFPKQSW